VRWKAEHGSGVDDEAIAGVLDSAGGGGIGSAGTLAARGGGATRGVAAIEGDVDLAGAAAGRRKVEGGLVEGGGVREAA